MSKIEISTGDFLKNAGIVGLKYLLDNSDADEEIHYGITDDGQSLWIDSEYIENADWTQLYFDAFVKKYGSLTVYQAVLDKIDNILDKLENENWDISNKENLKFIKDELKFINDKLLSNSYKSGFETIKQDIQNPEIYELLKNSKLKENMEKEKLYKRLQELQNFLKQPLCKEIFSMKSIIYNYINRFWDNKSFLLVANASKDMKKVFEMDFSEPLKIYVSKEHEKSKDMCIDCNGQIDSKDRVSIAFMKEQADDLSRKRSAFWNCKVDAYLCPVCAFIYSLVPLGFTLVGKTFVFVNMNQDVTQLLMANPSSGKLVYTAQQEENEKYSSWIARTIDLLLQEKSKELGNIQVVTRGIGENDQYTFDIIPRDILILFSNEDIRKELDKLSKTPYVKVGKDFWNIHEEVILNILRYHNQYKMINQLLKMAIESEATLFKARVIYDIQLKINLLRKNKKSGGELMNRYMVREKGYELRNVLLKAKGSNDDACIRGTIYQLLNALSVGNVEHFMEVIMRIYCSTKLQVPSTFIEFLKDRDTFVEYGYAFLLGLQGSHYEKKEEKVND